MPFNKSRVEFERAIALDSMLSMILCDYITIGNGNTTDTIEQLDNWVQKQTGEALYKMEAMLVGKDNVDGH